MKVSHRSTTPWRRVWMPRCIGSSASSAPLDMPPRDRQRPERHGAEHRIREDVVVDRLGEGRPELRAVRIVHLGDDRHGTRFTHQHVGNGVPPYAASRKRVSERADLEVDEDDASGDDPGVVRTRIPMGVRHERAGRRDLVDDGPRLLGRRRSDVDAQPFAGRPERRDEVEREVAVDVRKGAERPTLLFVRIAVAGRDRVHPAERAARNPTSPSRAASASAPRTRSAMPSPSPRSSRTRNPSARPAASSRGAIVASLAFSSSSAAHSLNRPHALPSVESGS